jgi:prophage tail gpP-like protein
MASEPPVELLVDGQRYGGWQTVEISRSIEALAGSFALSLTEQHANKPAPWPISDKAECSALVGGVPVITGFLDQTTIDLDSNARSVSVNGRDRAGDLVDCSVQLSKWSFVNVDVLGLARKICAPYGVKVSLQAGLAAKSVTIPKKKYSIDPGDTAADALGNLLKLAGLLAVSDGLGGIILTRAGSTRIALALVEGVNVKSATGKFTVSGRYRNYEVMGSHKGRDDLSGPQAAGVKGVATDSRARAGRTLIVRPDHNLTAAIAKDAAEWEAASRAARGEQLTVRAPGWGETPNDPVWPINALVQVKVPSCRINGTALIAGVTLRCDVNEGMTSDPRPAKPRLIRPEPVRDQPRSAELGTTTGARS